MEPSLTSNMLKKMALIIVKLELMQLPRGRDCCNYMTDG